MATPKVSLKPAKDPVVAETEELTENPESSEIAEASDKSSESDVNSTEDTEDGDKSTEANEITDSGFEKASFRAVKFPIFNPYLNVTFSTESFSDPVDFDGYNTAQVDAGLLEVKVSE